MKGKKYEIQILILSIKISANLVSSYVDNSIENSGTTFTLTTKVTNMQFRSNMTWWYICHGTDFLANNFAWNTIHFNKPVHLVAFVLS